MSNGVLELRGENAQNCSSFPPQFRDGSGGAGWRLPGSVRCGDGMSASFQPNLANEIGRKRKRPLFGQGFFFFCCLSLAQSSMLVVFGSRFLGAGAHRVLYYWHSVGNRLLTTFSNMATDLNLWDMETGYKVFRREIIQGEIEEDRFGFEPEIVAKVSQIERAHLRGAHLLLRPHLRRREEDRLARRFQRLALHSKV